MTRRLRVDRFAARGTEMCAEHQLGRPLSKQRNAVVLAASFPHTNALLSHDYEEDERCFDRVLVEPTPPVVEIDRRRMRNGLGVRVPLTKVDSRPTRAFPLAVQDILMLAARAMKARPRSVVFGLRRGDEIDDDVVRSEDVPTDENAARLSGFHFVLRPNEQGSKRISAEL